MRNITLQLPAEYVIPLAEMAKQWLDAKYPCTTDDNDGNDAPPEDRAKFLAINHLARAFHKNKHALKGIYQELITEIKKAK